MSERFRPTRPSDILTRMRVFRIVLASMALLLGVLACAAPAAPTEAPAAPTEAPSEPESAKMTLVVTEMVELPLTTATAAMALPTQQAVAPTALPVQPAIPEQRLLIFEWPPKIRLGDSEIIRLSLVMDEHGKLTPTAYVQGSELSTKPVEIPNLYDTHNVIVEARLDIEGLVYRDWEESQALKPGRPVSFSWSVRATEIGQKSGTAWMYLHFIPRNGGEEDLIALSAQIVEIEAVNFLGLGGSAARLTGALGAVVGSLLGLDNVISGMLKLLQLRKGSKA